MPTSIRASQSPRKQPSQARSTITVDAVIEATLQVLQREGYARLTTTRVAERAGVSIGSVYQYFPNRAALIAEVVRRHLMAVALAVDTAAAAHAGDALPRLIEAIVRAFLDAKCASVAITRSIQPALADIGIETVVRSVTQRGAAHLSALLATRRELRGEDTALIAEILVAALAGPVNERALDDPARLTDPAFGDHLVTLALGYIASVTGRTAARG